MGSSAVVTEPLALERYRPHIEAALAYADATHDYADVAQMISAGHLQFWPGPDSVIVSELIDYPGKSVLNIFLAGGHLDELNAMLPTVLAWGKSKGCTAASFLGRRGWARTFVTRQGWKQTHVLFSVDL